MILLWRVIDLLLFIHSQHPQHAIGEFTRVRILTKIIICIPIMTGKERGEVVPIKCREGCSTAGRKGKIQSLLFKEEKEKKMIPVSERNFSPYFLCNSFSFILNLFPEDDSSSYTGAM